MTDLKGNVTTRTYDKANRLKEVKADTDQPTVYEYNDNGSTKSVTYPNGSKELYTYDKNSLIKTLQNYQGSTLLDTYSYTYDAAMNQTSKNESIRGTTKGTTTFTYDGLNRLKTLVEPEGTRTEYTYDAGGNRKTEKVTSGSNATTTLYTYNAQNWLMSTSVSTEGTQDLTKYTYDFNGNRIGKSLETTKAIDPANPVEPSFGMFIYGQASDNPKISDIIAGSVRLEYDLWNQLSQTSDGSGITTYTYNAQGYRVEKTVNGQTTRYVYDKDKVILELDSQGVQKGRNVHGNSLLTRKSGADTVYLMYNGHGDVTALIGTTGQLRATYDYDAFGNPIASSTQYYDASGNPATDSTAIDNPYRYAGYQYDGDSDLYYLNARYYDAGIARFMTEDTVQGELNNPLSLNLYTYVQNNPLRYLDPSGHVVKETGESGGFLMGAPSTYEGGGGSSSFGKTPAQVKPGAAGQKISIPKTQVKTGAVVKTTTPAEPIKSGTAGKTTTSAEPAKPGKPATPAPKTPSSKIQAQVTEQGTVDTKQTYKQSLESNEGKGELPKAEDIIFGSEAKSSQKLQRQMDARRWTNDSVKGTVSDYYTTRSATNRATGNPATVYYNKDGSYIIVDNVTNELVQVSNKIDSNWTPDSSIINPYLP
ncbi:MAG: hypothetical protein K6T85_07155 [Gorillibacterium sp.]|nr:hypothetical protein [Gorillibacterium sp.]